MNKTRRASIILALVAKLKAISLVNGYRTDLGEQVFNRLIFWDQIREMPALCVTSGLERIVHQGHGLKDRYLQVSIKAFVDGEDPQEILENLLEDIEAVIDQSGRLEYTDSQGNLATTRDIIITDLDTDQGVLAPLGIGEVNLEVKY